MSLTKKKKKTPKQRIAPYDKRGYKAPTFKTLQENMDVVKEYTSHFSRIQAPKRKFLNFDF